MFVARALNLFVPMRMNKNGNQALTTSDILVPNWTADGSFPGTVITTNKLVLGAGTGVNVTAAIPYTAGFSGTITISIYKNGVQIGPDFTGTGTSGTVTPVNAALNGLTFTAGETLEMRGRCNSGSFPYTIVASGCFLQAS